LSGAPLALRMDDVGAASKRYEVYARRDLALGPLRISGNFLFLKYLPPFKAWGPYRELSAPEWDAILRVLQGHNAVLTVAVTAAWVNWDGNLTPFPQRFAAQAAALREGVQAGLIEIANHGLTHCLLEGRAFRPAWRHSNRKAHREFWPHVPLEIQEDHIRRAQGILQETFETEVITFVPPGNVFSDDTLEIAARHGLRIVSCAAPPRPHPRLTLIGNERVVAFHDREIVMGGTGWLRAQLDVQRERRFCFVRDLVSTRGAA